ncbi:hypothetical protein BH10BAC1_BH10BAC1_05720 [soil metagenome]
MKYILLIVITFSLSSCSLFYKVAFGIKKPRMESYSSITEYAKTLNIEPSNLAFAKDSASQMELHAIFKGTPEILIFNKSKIFLPYKSDSVSCNAPIDSFLKNICEIESSHASFEREIDYTHLLSLLYDKNNILNDTTIDFIIFADFVKYFPKVNSSHIIDWNREFNNHLGNCNAKIIYVNLDYLESWGMSKKSLPTLRLRQNKK